MTRVNIASKTLFISSLFVSGFLLSGCQETLSSGSGPLLDNSQETTPAVNKEFELTNMLEGFFAAAFKQEDGTGEDSELTEPSKNLKPPQFKSFSQVNTKSNIKIAVVNNPKVVAAEKKLDGLIAEIEMIKSEQKFTSSIRGVGGLSVENRETEAAASLNISARKLIYESDTSNLLINSKADELEASKKELLIAANTATLEAFEAWVQLFVNKEVLGRYQEGLNKARPLITQIESVSLSGLSDKKAFLSAQQSIMEVEDNYSDTLARKEVLEAEFLKVFPLAQLESVIEGPSLGIEESDVLKEPLTIGKDSIERQKLLQSALEKKVLSLQAGQRPLVAFSASVDAPARDLLDDGTANAGLLLTYALNDGGRAKSEIKKVQAELAVLINRGKDMERALSLQYRTTLSAYKRSIDRIDTKNLMIKTLNQIQAMAKQQVVSGRSTIKDILDAEFKIAKLELDLIFAKAQQRRSLVQLRALTGALYDDIGWPN